MHQNKNVTIARVNSNQACAACKYQRRKCPPDCILAPYFPHDRQRQFLNAHKLFGVSNITKSIRHLDQRMKDEAMKTIIIQSDVRANDPVGGCYRIIRQLERQIECAKNELIYVRRQIAYCKAQSARIQQIQQLSAGDVVDAPDSYPLNHSYDLFSADALGSNEHINNNNNSDNDNNSIVFQPHPQPNPHDHDHDQDISLLPDSCGMQGTIPSHVPIENNKFPSPTHPDECDDFRPLDFSITNHSHDLGFDYDQKIVQGVDGNFSENKATFEDRMSFRDQEFKDTASLFSLAKSSTAC